MIDYIRLRLDRQKYFEAFNNPQRYNLVQNVRLADGTLSNLYKGEYERMMIEVNPHHIVVHGSLHKFFNKNVFKEDQNWTDFTYAQLDKAIIRLSQRMNFNPEEAVIENIEFGVNIEIDNCPKAFLQDNLIMMKNKEPSMIKEFGEEGQLRQFRFSQYALKIYDKGKQYRLDKNLLRIELKSFKSEVITGRHAKWCLADLLNKYILFKLRGALVKRTKELWICDTVDSANVKNDKDYQDLLKFINPKYWVVHAVNNKHRRERRKFKKLMQVYELDSIKNEIVKKVKNKSKQLIYDNDTVKNTVVIDTNI